MIKIKVYDKDIIKEFARWISINNNSSSLLSELKKLICMRCGSSRLSVLEAAKGGQWCCYPPVE